MILVAMLQQCSQNAEAQNQVQLRVEEKIDTFMQAPVQTLKLFHDFFDLDGFRNNLTPADRKEAQIYLYSLVKALSDVGLKPFYGLEDGTMLAYWHSTLNLVPELNYREPGNSGYAPIDANLGKYLNVCMDKTNGTAVECAMSDVHPLYISCIGGDGGANCPLIECPRSEPETKSGIRGNSSDSEVKMCPNYEILNYTEKNPGQRLGFVPTTTSCINADGDFSQTVGEVLIESDRDGGVVLNGACTFPDGTIVDRVLSGNFENCVNGPCNTTFNGGYQYRNYDARWRSWYIDCKAAQRPQFSDPYVFFSFGTVGITYTHPIYTKDDQNGSVFYGVLAVDMELGDISKFLVSTFNGTIFTAAVYEDAEPHKMIALSTGTDILAWYLISDPTKECPADKIGNAAVCQTRQETISTFAKTEADQILFKAHQKYFQGNSPLTSRQVVEVLADENDVTSQSYIATAVLYGISDANLRWRIVVTTPVEDDPFSSIEAGDLSFILIFVLGGLGCALCLLLFLAFYRRRNERVVQFADFKFTSAFILGCALLNLTTLTLVGEATDESCMLRMWTFYMATSLCLSPLFVKAYRTYALLGSSVQSAMGQVHKSYLVRSLIIPFVQAVILAVATFFDPPLATYQLDVLSLVPLKEIECKHELSLFEYLQGVFTFVLLVMGCSLAYVTRNIDPRFGDAKALLFAMYNIAFTTLMLAIIIGFVDISGSSEAVLQAIGVFWATVFSAAGFVVPRLMEATKERTTSKKKNRRLRSNLQQKRHARITSVNSQPRDDALHNSEDSLKILVCIANVGNAPPTFDSMKAWIPEGGSTSKVTMLDGDEIIAEHFDLIVVGMQEAVWGKKSVRDGDEPLVGSSVRRKISKISVRGEDPLADEADEEEVSQELAQVKEEAYLSSVEGQDTVALRNMIASILGDSYTNIAQEQRGQMRQSIWALKGVAPFIKNLKVTKVNTGIGNVLANKGGIVISMIYQDTRIAFLSAHLAAHEGESFYKNRCDNVFDILKGSKTFDLSKKHDIDLALCSHHMIVCGDLNFRTVFDGERNSHEDNVKRAKGLIEAEDWSTLYSFDELHKGLRRGDLLNGFNTLPCDFNPTFKVNRSEGYDYKDQRVPSYTDRILYKSSPGLSGNLEQIAYEPCADFTTSDHKPIRGAFSIIPNDMVPPIFLEEKYRIEFSNLECEDLLVADRTSSDPYIMFIWDSAEVQEERSYNWHFWSRKKRFPATSFKRQTLNPKWPGKKISLVTTSQEMRTDATLYVVVYDYDFMSDDDMLGTLPLNISELLKIKHGDTSKELTFDSPLERYGKCHGRIKFKLEISQIVG